MRKSGVVNKKYAYTVRECLNHNKSSVLGLNLLTLPESSYSITNSEVLN